MLLRRCFVSLWSSMCKGWKRDFPPRRSRIGTPGSFHLPWRDFLVERRKEKDRAEVEERKVCFWSVVVGDVSFPPSPHFMEFGMVSRILVAEWRISRLLLLLVFFFFFSGGTKSGGETVDFRSMTFWRVVLDSAFEIGDLRLWFDSIRFASVGSEVASQISVSPISQFLTSLFLFFLRFLERRRWWRHR